MSNTQDGVQMNIGVEKNVQERRLKTDDDSSSTASVPETESKTTCEDQRETSSADEESYSHPQTDVECGIHVACEDVPPKAPVEIKAPRLEALDGPRWCASAMIISFHFYNPHNNSSLNLGSFAECGALWTQFFFVLSGFVLSYVEMVRPLNKAGKLSQLQYVRKRLTTIYPTYLAILVMTLCTMQPRSTFEWKILPLHILLLQAWIPILGPNNQCAAQQWVGVSWFMSALVVYWLLLRPVSSCVRKLSLSACFFLLLLLWSVSFFFGAVWQYRVELFCPTTAPDYGRECVEWLWCALKNNPAGYFHVFVSGIVGARVFILTCTRDVVTGQAPTQSTQKLTVDVTHAPYLCKFGIVVGYIFYAFIVCFVNTGKWYLFWHNGGLLPIMLLVILGGALGIDPIAKFIFQSQAFLMLGRISYAQYLTQYLVMRFFSQYMADEKPRLCIFPFALLTVAYLIERYITRVYTQFQRTRQDKGEVGWDERCIEKIDKVVTILFHSCSYRGSSES